MPSLTIVACPKPFHSSVAVTQRNAITSWSKLEPPPQIILVGDEPGTADICRELSLSHVPDVQRNHHGTPLLHDVIRQGERAAGAGLLCFINADIILMSDFMKAVRRVAIQKSKFLMIGQRTDLDVTRPIEFARADWETHFKREVTQRGVLHDVCGIDYFVFPPRLFGQMPPLVIGRAAVDNFLVFSARRLWVSVIDATPSITAVHQNHDYSHHAGGRDGVYFGEEAETNLRLAGGPGHLFWIDDHTHILAPGGLKFDWSRSQLRRHWDRLPATAPPVIRPVVKLLRRVWLWCGVVLRAVGLKRPLPAPSQAKQA